MTMPHERLNHSNAQKEAAASPGLFHDRTCSILPAGNYSKTPAWRGA
jgi:hypothetical protein